MQVGGYKFQSKGNFRTYKELGIYAGEILNTQIGVRSLTSSSITPPPKPSKPPLPTAGNIKFIFLNTSLCLKEPTASIAPTATSPAPQSPEPQSPPLQNSHPVIVTATRSLDSKYEVASTFATSSSYNSVPRQQPTKLLASTRSVQREYWNHRGDHLTLES